MKPGYQTSHAHSATRHFSRLLSWLALVCIAGPILASCSGGPSALTLPSPTSLPTTCTNATAGMAFNCSIPISGGTPPYKISTSPTGLPKGVIAAVSGDNVVLSGTPEQQQLAKVVHFAKFQVHPDAEVIVDNVGITIGDSKGQTATINFSISVSGAVVALAVSTASPLPGGTAGTAYSTTITATGGTTPYTWSVSGLPQGLTYSTSGTPSTTITGTTVDVGIVTLSVAVTDSETPPVTVSGTFKLTIAQAAALAISTASLPNGTLNSTYPSQQLTAMGGIPPYTWTKMGGTLPGSLTLSSAGVISGNTGGTAGTFSFTVQVSDGESPPQTQQKSLSITVNSTTTPLTITTMSPLPGAKLSTPYTTMVTASGGTEPYTWNLGSSSNLPPGFSPLMSGTPAATISGTPTATGTFQFTLVVTDSARNTASAIFLLTVTGSSTLNCPPTVNLTLCGTYLLGVRGFNSSGGPTALGVSFVANNSGEVISGVKGANDSVAGYSTTVITGGGYAMDASGDGRGVLTLIDSGANTTVFRFVLESAANAGAGSIEEFDSTGNLASGALFGPGTPPIPQFPANGMFGLQLEGINGAGNRVGLLAVMQIGATGCDGSSGSLYSAEGEPVVTNTAGTIDKTLTLTGSCTASDSNTAVGNLQLTISGGTPFANQTLHFLYLNLGGQGALLLESDPISSNQPILSGAGLGVSPSGGFNASSLGCPCIFVGQGSTNGNASTGGEVSSVARIVTSPGGGTSGTLSGVLDENSAGSITSAGAWPYSSYTIDSNGMGTMTGSGYTVHFVATGSGGNGFTFDTLDESMEVQVGSFRQQNATSIGSNADQPYIMGRDLGTLGITHSTDHFLGVLTPTGSTSGNLSGTADVISTSGSFAGVSATGSYMSIDPTTGRGTGSANLTGGTSAVAIVLYVTRERQFVILDAQSSIPYLVGARLQ
jgi:hypothetical protein